MGRYLILFLALIAVIAAPVVLKPAVSARTRDFAPQDRLVIITPHVEAIRFEFEIAFQQWMQEKHGRSVVIDWRVPGGTSEIAKVVTSEYQASLENYWRRHRPDPWRDSYGQEFLEAASKSEARTVWLASDAGIGIDLFFGGGSPDFSDMKKKGCLVTGDAKAGTGLAGVKAAHPDWFSDKAIPAKWAGETYIDPDLTWVGTCLSTFGLCYNLDFHQRRHLTALPRQWVDLTNPVYQNQVALADPGKSGTVVKMLETILQQAMQEAARGATTPAAKNAAWDKGWIQGLTTIQRIGANARYWTDSSTKIPLDVSDGEAAAGMCIDFYARNFIDRLEQFNSGHSRMAFTLPVGGTTPSVDPIGMFRGAPNPELATRFIEFNLSMEGQRLWAYKKGAPGGPRQTSLRRLPVRRDYYVPANLAHASDPDILPFTDGTALIYDASLTGSSFTAIRLVIRAMCIDTHDELKEAWAALIENRFPPQATAALGNFDMVNRANVTGTLTTTLRQGDKLVAAELSRNLAQQFRQQYGHAADLARRGM
ncbi:MAG: iron transporter substrate-binding protein [Verrucomicrobiales bacterium]|nr:iron transporter substrate-binding protein [Verrucomicrobiales bacterium]